MQTMTTRYSRTLQALTALALAGCASSGPGDPLPSPTPVVAGQTGVTWPVTTRAHIDLWLHGFALISDDTGRVPMFKRGYAARIADSKSRGNVQTSLDVNRDRLRSRYATNRTLLGAQFLAMRFGSWEDLRQAIDLFLRAEGDPGEQRRPQQRPPGDRRVGARRVRPRDRADRPAERYHGHRLPGLAYFSSCRAR